MGKNLKNVIVPMYKRAQTLLEHYFAIHNAWPIGVGQMQKIIKKIANKAKITQEVTPHILPHTFSTLALQKGISLASVQKILGHNSLMTSAIYLNSTDTHVMGEYANVVSA